MMISALIFTSFLTFSISSYYFYKLINFNNKKIKKKHKINNNKYINNIIYKHFNNITLSIDETNDLITYINTNLNKFYN